MIPVLVDQELQQRYEQTQSAVRRRRERARQFRHRGSIDYLGEYELALGEGQQAALAWLLGESAVAPVTGSPTRAGPDPAAAELRAAEPRPSDPWKVPAVLPDSFTGELTYLDGVVEVLRWFLDESEPG
jgi:hypothetical protein